MRRFLGIVCLLLCVSTPAIAAESKFAFVDIQKIAEELELADKLESKLRKEFSERQEEIIATEKKFTKKLEKHKKDEELFDDAARSKAERELGNLHRELQRMKLELQEDINGRRIAEQTRFMDVLVSAVKEEAKNRGYDVVLNKQVAILVADQYEITKEVLTVMKNTGKV